MSYGAIGGPGGSRNPFGGPTRQGYQPVGKKTSFCPLSVTASCSQGPTAAAPLLVPGVLIHRNQEPGPALPGWLFTASPNVTVSQTYWTRQDFMRPCVLALKSSVE